MKRFKFLVVLTLLFSLAAVQVRADEGMWLLQYLEKMNIKTMRGQGCKLTAQQIYDINHSSLKDAIMIFGGGCTAEVVSDKGLVLTNHHCGYGSIQKLSAVGKDYLRDGYWAMNSSEELVLPDLTVTFIDKFVDATPDMLAAETKTKGMDPKAKVAFMKKVTDSLKNVAIGGDKTLTAMVQTFNQGNNYYVITSRTFKDVRFVGAPPSSIGKFGGETDNWEWPRHTGDFSVFRIYADKNNNPASYSKDNVPYNPKKYLTISMKGYKPNDFAMIIGFPGRTQRYMTSSEVEEMQNISNAAEAYCRTIKEGIWQKAMRADEHTNIQYASKFAYSSNFRKKAIAMNDAFKSLNVIARRAEAEKEFMKWVEQSPERKVKYGDCLEKINSVVKERAASYYAFEYFIETLNDIEIIQPVYQLAYGKIDDKNFKEETADFYKDYSPALDRETTKALIKIYRDKVTDPKYIPSFYKEIDSAYNGSIDKYVDNMFDKTYFTSPQKALTAMKDSAFTMKNDPVFQMFVSMIKVAQPAYAEYNKYASEMQGAKKAYMEGQIEMAAEKDKFLYPDANFTMRLTYGKVGGYEINDKKFNYYTTLDGVMAKENPNDPEFVVPAKLKELWKAKDYGKYAMKNGELPVCFLTNNDITGGNSGSDVLNAKGELIGLAFDGNYESMSGDVIFEPDLQRCICVDIRYVLFVMDKFGGAGYLLNEMKFN